MTTEPTTVDTNLNMTLNMQIDNDIAMARSQRSALAVVAVASLLVPCTAWASHPSPRLRSSELILHARPRVARREASANTPRMIETTPGCRTLRHREPEEGQRYPGTGAAPLVAGLQGGAARPEETPGPQLPILACLDQLLIPTLDHSAPRISWQLALALAIIVPHGLSDLFATLPSRVAFLGGGLSCWQGVGAVYAAAAALTLSVPSAQHRYLGLLCTASLFHLRRDLPALVHLGFTLLNGAGAGLPLAAAACSGLVAASWAYTAALHLCWAKWPGAALAYLSLVHTGLHYCTVLPQSNGAVVALCVAGRCASLPALPLAVAFFGATTGACFCAFRQWGHRLLNLRWAREGIWIAPVIAHIYCVG